MAFTEEQQQQAAHLFGLIKRQMAMGVSEGVVLYVLAAATGQTAAEIGLSRDDIQKLVPTMQAAYDGHVKGHAQAKVTNNGG